MNGTQCQKKNKQTHLDSVVQFTKSLKFTRYDVYVATYRRVDDWKEILDDKTFGFYKYQQRHD